MAAAFTELAPAIRQGPEPGSNGQRSVNATAPFVALVIRGIGLTMKVDQTPAVSRGRSHRNPRRRSRRGRLGGVKRFGGGEPGRAGGGVGSGHQADADSGG
jgi:hypothetical protein